MKSIYLNSNRERPIDVILQMKEESEKEPLISYDVF